MTHFPPELIEAAKAMYEVLNPPIYGLPRPSWERAAQDHYCQAFAAGLRSLIPLSEAARDIMLETGGDDANAFAAVITYFAGDGK